MTENPNTEAPENTEEPATAEAPENTEPTARIGILTPLGVMEVDPAKLPEGLRNAIAGSFEREGMPQELRAAFTKASDPNASTGADGEDPAKAPDSEHGRTCGCSVESHRQQVWKIADAAFPNDPHLWKMMESLFTLSVLNPEEISEEKRRSILNEIQLHLNHHPETTAQPLSPEEQLVAQFREELGL